MSRKYVSPFSGKKITAHQFLAGLVIRHNEDSGYPLSANKQKQQYIAAAKIIKAFPDDNDIDDVLAIVAAGEIKSLFPLTYKRCSPLRKKLEAFQERTQPKKHKATGGIEKL